MADASGNNLHGGLFGSPVLGVPGALTSSSDTSARFTASGDGIVIPDSNALTFGATATFEAWIKPDVAAIGTYQTILQKFHVNTSEVEFEFLPA